MSRSDSAGDGGGDRVGSYAKHSARNSHADKDCGYAALSALILCAILSVLCVAVLTLSQQEKRRSDRQLQAYRTEEVLNEALLSITSDILLMAQEARLERDLTIQGQSVKVIAEPEAYKWPIDQAQEVSEVALVHKTQSLKKDDLLALIGSPPADTTNTLHWPRNDCVRRLFSPYGYASPTEEPRTDTSSTTVRSKDGQIWRLRAITGQIIREQLVRFTGDPVKAYGVIVSEDYSLATLPECG
ncbi:hypothetical protein [Asticcacaulis tiandongensis]|uniref:hypothetical protein n=1 Tax=Asticcacaulis tiandongensis TaxID=2565365 RepID=UPI00112C32EF|nr:hypothetical protein [Asticcacaulis tiandongensis]